MKHESVRGIILAIAFVSMLFAGLYFDSYKAGGPIILMPLGHLVYGSILLVGGSIVLFDTFFDYRNGFKKRERKLVDAPLALSPFFVFMGFAFVTNGILELIPMFR